MPVRINLIIHIIIGDSRLKHKNKYFGTPKTEKNVRAAQKELKEQLYMMYMFGLP